MVIMEVWQREELLGWCLQFAAFITSCRVSSAYGIIVNHTGDQLNLFGDLVMVILHMLYATSSWFWLV